MNTKELLIRSTFKNNKFSPNMLRSKVNESLRNLCREATPFLSLDSTDVQRAWHIYNDLYSYPLCDGGNEKTKFLTFEKGYQDHCDRLPFQCGCWESTREKYSKNLQERNRSGKMNEGVFIKYGVEHVSQIPGVVDKLGKGKGESTTAKIQKTMMERYGAKTTLESSILREKSRQTCIERYGAKTTLESSILSNKSRQTMMERYGVVNPMQSDMIREKTRQSVLEKYGVSNPMQSSAVREKSRQTCIERYGVPVFNQIKLKPIIRDIYSSEWWSQFTSSSQCYSALREYISHSTILSYIHEFRPDLIGSSQKISSQHQVVIDFLYSLSVNSEVNTTHIIPPYELDIFIPEKKFAIEVNGVYWHSELLGKNSTYHLNKTLMCEKVGVRLLQFWDYEIDYRSSTVKSIIQSSMGLNSRLHARTCEIVDIDSKTEKRFLNDNHLQGYTPSKHCLGLLHSGILVSLMSFGRSRFSKQFDHELLRFSSLQGITVVGGASRLFSRRPPGSIISYADRRYSVGGLYRSLGFKLSHTSSPSYKYTKNYREFYHRSSFQKHKLPDLLSNYNPHLSEWENMKCNGFDRVWDCGTLVFHKN